MRMMLYGAAAVLLASILVAIGFKFGRDNATAKHLEAAVLVQQAADAVEARTATRIAGIRVINQTINGQVREVIRESTVYSECLVPADMQRLLEHAREGRAAPPADRGSVPAIVEGAALESR
jgi:hypothetical protein